MAYGIKMEVWGDLAAFNRPEMKVERVSYDIITPSAARGILEAIYWKPEMRWVIDEIHVLRPIRFTYVRRNEISAKIPIKGSSGVATAQKYGKGKLGMSVESVRQQRAARVLRDVRYGITGHVDVVKQELTSSGANPRPEAKHLEMFRRRAAKGQYFHHPYLGVREFPADFKLVERFPQCPEELRGDRNFGFMLHDIDFTPDETGGILETHRGTRLSAEARFFEACMRDGVVKVPPLDRARRESP